MAFLNENAVVSDINGNNLKYCYLFFGEDAFLKRHYVKKLSEKVAEEDDFFNYHKFEGDCDLQEVYEAVSQYPMMNDKKCVILKDYPFEKCSKEDFERLLTLCTENIDTALLIVWFDYTEFDSKKSERFKKLTTAIQKKNSAVVQFYYKTTAELVKILIDGAKKRGCTLGRNEAILLIETAGSDIETLQNELTKVCAYCQGEITAEAVKEVCIKTVEQSVYNLSSHIFTGEVGNALKVLDELYFMNVAPMNIFYTIAGVYVDLSRAFALNKSGVSYNTAVEDFEYKNKAFLLERAVKQIRKLTFKQISLSLFELIEADRKIKSYNSDSRRILEELFVRLSYIAVKGESVDKT